MGRSRRTNRRSRTDRKNSNSPRNHLDRDDDYPMHDAENNNAPSFKQRRGRGYNHNNNNRSNNGRQNGDDRNSASRNPLDRFANPFENINLDGSTFDDEPQGTRFRGIGSRGRGRGQVRGRGGGQGHGNRNSQQHNDYNGQRYSNATSATNDSNEGKHQSNDSDHTRNQNRHNNRNGSRPSSSATRSSSPARLARFCTECSAVRRANLTLRDWLGSAILRAPRFSTAASTRSAAVADGRGRGRGGRGRKRRTSGCCDWRMGSSSQIVLMAF
ncbi:hypothetical protein CHU98_g4018 [Xylaria longipes]|nr:hypothetical protein CHU98_g4018 [Xylaria longipes]